MKKYLSVTIITLIILLAASIAKANASEIITKSFQSNHNYTAISISKGINLIVEERTEGNIVAIGTQEMLDLLNIKVEGKTLFISLPDKIKVTERRPEVRIPNNGIISSFNISGASTVRCIPVLKGDRIEIEGSSASRFTATIEVNELKAEFASAARGNFSGKAENAEFELSSSARVDCSKLTVNKGKVESSSASRINACIDECTIETSSAAGADVKCKKCIAEASSGSSISVDCSDMLTAQASSGAQIKVTGSCQLRKKTSSGGSINRF